MMITPIAASRHDRPWLAKELTENSWVRQVDYESSAELSRLHDDHPHKLLSVRTPNFELLAQKVLHELENGLGFVVLRGLPFKDVNLDLNRLAKTMLSMGSHFGTPVSQARDGKLISLIQDEGLNSENPQVRGHQTSAALPFHCDRADVIGLLCVRPAAEGGRSLVVSASAVHDILLKEQPELLEVLYEPFPQDRRGEEAPGEAPWFQLPIFLRHDGRFVSRYIRRFIESSQRHADAPRLTSLQYRALDAIDNVLAKPGVALELDFRPGDFQFLNNATIWHARTAFRGSIGGTERLLLRLWLASSNSRELPPEFQLLYGSTAAGAVRGGIPSVEL